MEKEENTRGWSSRMSQVNNSWG